MLKKRFFKTKDECEVTFELESADAGSVELICEVNGWAPIAMKKTRRGPFRAKLRFPRESEFEFRYLVDGRSWLNDDGADAYRPNGLGGSNSVLDTTPAPSGVLSASR